MFSFQAYFWNNDVYINEKFKYAVGEILTAHLNTDYFSSAESFWYDLKRLRNKLLMTDDMSHDAYARFKKLKPVSLGHIAGRTCCSIRRRMQLKPRVLHRSIYHAATALKFGLLSFENLNKHWVKVLPRFI